MVTARVTRRLECAMASRTGRLAATGHRSLPSFISNWHVGSLSRHGASHGPFALQRAPRPRAAAHGLKWSCGRDAAVPVPLGTAHPKKPWVLLSVSLSCARAVLRSTRRGRVYRDDGSGLISKNKYQLCVLLFVRGVSFMAHTARPR